MPVIWKAEGGCYWSIVMMMMIVVSTRILLLSSNLVGDSATATRVNYNYSSSTTMDGPIDGTNGFEAIRNEFDPFERELDIPILW
jgi:hypothetical protein